MNLGKSLNLCSIHFSSIKVRLITLPWRIVVMNRDNILVLGKQLFNKLVSFHAMGMMRMDTLNVHRDGTLKVWIYGGHS